MIVSLKPTLERLGLRQTELAKLLDVSTRTVSQWATGGQPLPGTVLGYLRLLEAAAPEVREQELARLADRAKQLQEGLYRIVYAQGEGIAPQAAFAVLRNGKIAGTDSEGTAYTGSYRFDRARSTNVVTIRFAAARDGASTQGNGGVPKGAMIELSWTIPRPDPASRSSLMLDGQSIAVEIIYTGPLPN